LLSISESLLSRLSRSSLYPICLTKNDYCLDAKLENVLLSRTYNLISF
jgi:hypothetical protein